MRQKIKCKIAYQRSSSMIGCGKMIEISITVSSPVGTLSSTTSTASSSTYELKKLSLVTIQYWCTHLKYGEYKLQLRNESRQWKQIYSTKIHHMARDALRGLLDYIRTTSTKLHTEVTDLDTLRYVMNVLKDVREKESSIEMEIAPIFDMYAMLDHYLPGGLVDQDEMDQKSVLRPPGINWPI